MIDCVAPLKIELQIIFTENMKNNATKHVMKKFIEININEKSFHQLHYFQKQYVHVRLKGFFKFV